MKTLFAILLSTFFVLNLSAQTALQGKVTVKETGEELIGANIVLKMNGVLVAGICTDFNGNYFINIDPGTYDVTVSYLGYPDFEIQGVVVKSEQTNKLDIQMTEPEGVVLDEVVVTSYKVPLIRMDNTTQGSTITRQGGKQRRAIKRNKNFQKKVSKNSSRSSQGQTVTAQEISNLPTRNVSALASTAAGLSQVDEGTQITVRGSRANATYYYIDGVRVRGFGSMIPSSEIDQLQIITGGTPAQYGDLQEFGSDLTIIQQSVVTPKKRVDPVVPYFEAEEYEKIVENDFISPKDEVFSTFSIDVDHAAYSNMRRYINSNRTPPRDAIRIEEMINYFQYDYPQPKTEVPFSIKTEIGDCPWNKKNKLLHIGLKGQNINLQDAVGNNLVFLIDVSGSMSSANKLDLIKPALKLLIDQLRPKDQVAIVTYAGNAGLVLPSTSGANKKAILRSINGLNPGGSTAGAQGIELAYKIASENFIEDGNNRIILATDGDFNVGVSSYEGLLKMIEKKRETGIYLTTLGFGFGNLKDNTLEVLADKGNGNYAYIDNISEAEKVFVTELTGTLYTIAKDVKIQLVFDPNSVIAYRLIGYENRLLETEDFDDDRKDAGELGAGHTVTAIYELEMSGATSKDLLNVKLRYKLPHEKQSRFINQMVANKTQPIEKNSENFQFSAAVAGFGLILRDSKYKGDADCEMVLELAENAQGRDEFGYREEFIQLVAQYRDMLTVSSK
jgi:Ca-activated chloride channel homolog